MPIRPKSVSPPLKIYEIRLDRIALDAMPSDARRNLFRFGHIANEINTLTRLMTFSFKKQPDGIMAIFSDMRAATLLRLLIGTTREGYLAVERSILKSPFGKAYIPLLESEGTEALTRVRAELGRMQLIAALRNEYSFHLPSDQELDAGYNKWPSDQHVAMYSGERRHASFYQMSHLLLAAGMMNLAADASMTASERLQVIVDDVSVKAIALSDFIDQLMITLVEHHKLAPLGMAEVATIDGVESISTFAIPPVMRD